MTAAFWKVDMIVIARNANKNNQLAHVIEVLIIYSKTIPYCT